MHDFECETELLGGDAAVVTVRGELDIYTCEGLRGALDELRSRGIGARFVIDLTECSFMDSTALGVLTDAKKRLGEAPLHIAAHVGALRVLTISGLESVFRIHRSRDEALAALQQREASSDAG